MLASRTARKVRASGSDLSHPETQALPGRGPSSACGYRKVDTAAGQDVFNRAMVMKTRARASVSSPARPRPRVIPRCERQTIPSGMHTSAAVAHRTRAFRARVIGPGLLLGIEAIGEYL
jgi:hypothetical protein